MRNCRCVLHRIAVLLAITLLVACKQQQPKPRAQDRTQEPAPSMAVSPQTQAVSSPSSATPALTNNEAAKTLAETTSTVSATTESASMEPAHSTSRQFIAGRVINAAGAAITSAIIDVTEPDGQPSRVLCDEQGRYRVEGLTTGPVKIMVSAPDFAPTQKSGVALGRDNVLFVLSPTQKRGFVGRVVDERDHNPVTSFRVKCEPEHQVILGPNPGEFSVGNLSSDQEFRLRIDADGFAPYETAPIAFFATETTTTRVFVLGPGGRVIGRVVSRDDEESPLSGIAVEVHAAPDKQAIGSPMAKAMTGADGRFTLEKVPSGSWQLVVSREVPADKTVRGVDVWKSGETDAGDIRLGPIRPGVLRGRVLRVPSKEPIAGVDVKLGGLGPVQTDSDGGFTFPQVPSGYYGLRVPEFKVTVFTSVLEGEPIKEMIVPVGGGTLEAKVQRGGQPVRADLQMRQTGQNEPRTESTQADGTVVVSTLMPGPWAISIIAKDTGIVTPWETIEILADGPTVKTLNLPVGRAVGRVVSADGKGIAGATITLAFRPADIVTQKILAQSDSEGNFAISGMPPGTYSLNASGSAGEGAARIEGVVVPAEGDSAPVQIKLSSELGTLESVVLSMKDGSPVQAAWCSLTTESGPFPDNSQRDASGRMVITQIPPGKYQVHVGAFSFSNAEHTVEIVGGQTVKLEDVLYEAGAVNLVVVDQSGVARSEVPVRLAPEDGSSVEAPRDGVTDPSGKWIVRGLYPGRYRITAQPKTGPAVSTPTVVRAANVSKVQIVVE